MEIRFTGFYQRKLAKRGIVRNEKVKNAGPAFVYSQMEDCCQ